MASDLSSGCIDDIDIFEEKEEGEISLEDVSSSEESHPKYRSDFRNAGRCTSCMSLQMCARWCAAARAARKSHRKQDAAHGKENRQHSKDPSSMASKHMVATLQEKNDDLVPISSDSDMEIVGLPGNSKQLHTRSKSMKVRNKKKKKRSHNSVVRIEEALSPAQVETYLVDVPVVKKIRSSRSHHRESSPPRYSVRSPLERPLARSPSRRYRATRPLKSRSPLRRSRSPVTRANLPEKKSPRKLRSPRRSPAPRSPVRSSLCREHASPSPQTYVDTYATKLLHKVRRLESVGAGSTKNLSKSKEHSSLKEKLSNMMKNQAEGSHKKPSSRKRNSTNVVNNNNNTKNGAAAAAEADDEDDIELLRRLALETQQNKSENKIEESRVKSESANAEESDDDDIETNELRIVALRSAIIKKHQKRVTRGIKSKRPVNSQTRVESPFNESFLDDIGISEEEDSSVKSMTRSSPILDDESNHPEDMDLDTDVEREKENDFTPYSPTDDLTREIVVEAELPETSDNNNEEDKLSSTQRDKNVRGERHPSPEGSDYIAGIDTPYSPSAPPETPNLDKFVLHRLAYKQSEKIASGNTESPLSPESSDCASGKSLSSYVPGVDTPYSPARIKETPKTDKFLSQPKNNTNTENTHSPTETPILDPELFPIFPNLPAVPQAIECINTDELNSASKMEDVDSAIARNLASTMLDESVKEVEASKDSEISLQAEKDEKWEPSATVAGVSALPLREEFFRTIDTIDKLPEVDLDGSPLVPVSNQLEAAELIIPIEIATEIVDAAIEPLYLQFLSDDVKDTNKIPTVVNRTLVPVPILKTNKQLQQPLPQKKVDNHAEPSFKSAEMRPVSVETAPVKHTTLFKPIKLCPIPKKPQVMTMAAAAFNTSFGDDSVKETKSDDEPVVVEVPTPVKEAKTTTTKSPPFGKSQNVDEESEKKKNGSGKKTRRRERLRDKKRASAAAESPNCAKESSSNRAKSGESNSSNLSGKKVKSQVGSASNANERVTRTSSKTSLTKSSENTKKIVQKGSVDKSMEREESPAKATTSKLGTGKVGDRKKRTPRKKQKSSKKVKRLSSNSAVTRTKLSDLEITENIELRANKSTDKEQKGTNKNEGDLSKAREESKKADEAERERRCSMDEDEEALRALLLASLPKRTKLVEASLSTPSTNPVARIAQLSDTSVDSSASKQANESTACLVESAFTPVNPLVLSSQSSTTSSTTQAKVEGPSATAKNTEVARKIFSSESNSSGVESSPRKRANSLIVKGPPKKIVKKALPVLASTKVVNNAKKYQNTLLQKKLNLQRAATMYRAQNGSRNITLNNLKNNDAARPSSPKISTASKMQRLVINLGSDTDSDADLESQPSSSISVDAHTEVRKPLSIPTTDFEKSVVQFLKDQRKKLESVTVSKLPTSVTTTSNKTVANSASPATEKLSGLYNTPLAVRHLPMSQQEEYRRLKQQIMERERQKLKKTIENGSASQNPSLKSPCTPPGPLSPASPLSATQKCQANQKVSSIATRAATSTLASSGKDKALENLGIQKKIELTKANENRPATNVTKVSKTTVAAISNKQLTKPPTTSSKVNSNIQIIPCNASTSKAPIKVLPKANSSIPIANIPANTSTPKAQSSIISKPHSSISSRASLPLAKGAVSTTEDRGKFVAEVPSASTKFSVESVPPLPATRINSASRSFLNPTEMLTIQIPNDKMQKETVASTGILNEECSSPLNGRNVGMLRILTKEQLNNRFVKIQVKQGPAGRTVTVSESPLSQDDVTRSASSSPIPKILPESRSDKSDKMMCCDSSLIVNESTVTRRSEKKTGESMVGDSDASTFVLSGSERNTRNDETVDSTASTIVLVHDNAHNDTTVDSAASTLLLAHDNSECRDSPAMARAEECEDGALTRNAKDAKQPKVEEVWEKIRSDVKNELETLTALPFDQQRIILIKSQENLVAKRNMVLDDLTEMSGCLRQWEVEREIQTKLIAEVRRLREQLRTAEKRLHEQRAQMNGMGPKVTKAHGKINLGRRECYKLSRICHGLGTKIIGQDYKVPDTGAQLLNDRLKEVAVHTRQLSKKKIPNIGSLSDSRDTNSPASSTGSDTVSENSFVESPSNSTTPLVKTTNVEETTNNSLTSETDLDDTRIPRNNSESPETSIVDSPSPNPVTKRVDVLTDEESESCKAHTPSEETGLSSFAKKDARSKEKEESRSSKTNAQTMEQEESNPSGINPQTKEKEPSSCSECNTNDDSDIPATNLVDKDRAEDIYIPSTSKSDLQGRLLLSDEQPPVKSKIDPYESVLTHLKASRSVNPGGILCPYELMGTCSDGDCQFYHLDPHHCQ